MQCNEKLSRQIEGVRKGAIYYSMFLVILNLVQDPEMG